MDESLSERLRELMQQLADGLLGDRRVAGWSDPA
ncbi:hypothetical protein J2W58_003003 [Pseudomonas psychrotolerans]|nr:hypothetical protein [Pseudomonas psychrotolerans]